HWAQSQAGFVVSAENLVIASDTEVLDAETWRWEAGARIQLVGGAQRSAHFTATLAGVESPVSGALQVGGYALPSEASRVRQLVCLVEINEEISLRTLEDLVIEIMAHHSNSKGSPRDTAFALAKVVTDVNALCREVCDPSERMHVTRTSVPSLLPHRQRIVILSALAVIENAPVCVVGGGAPVSNADDASLWWQGLNHFAHPDQVIVLWSATGPSPENISPLTVGAQADEGPSLAGKAR
ncbi:MAG: RND superfamily putative drug exporter, partial [Pontimonas sp.]